MTESINEVRPFRAEHYNPEKIEDIGFCLSRPYDVISPLEQDEYYQLHPNNVVRLILNKIEQGDTEFEQPLYPRPGFACPVARRAGDRLLPASVLLGV